MSNKDDSNYVSVGSWMWMMFVTAIPIIGQIMILIWAFTGNNESRKNYNRAILVWLLIFIAFIVVAVLLGSLPGVEKMRSWTHRP